MMIRRGFVAAAAAAVSLFVYTPGVFAAEGASEKMAETEAGGTKYEEIVVTSQRTEESIQDVPIAVSAFTGEMMKDRQIISPSDLQMNAPNVSYSNTNFGGSNFSIRGIGRLVIAASGENGVSIHVNDVAMPTNLPAVEFYDMERVEVLRGPQGTLFGKSATGGAINMITAKPQMGAMFGNVDGEYTNYDGRREKGMLNLPSERHLCDPRRGHETGARRLHQQQRRGPGRHRS